MTSQEKAKPTKGKTAANGAPKNGKTTSPEAVFAQGLLEMAGSSAVGVGSAVDVAIAGLCQSYTHALSLAFHDAVLDQQRRNILGQAALSRAVEEIQTADAKDFEDRLKKLKKGLDTLGVPEDSDMNAYAQLSSNFKEAMKNLTALKDELNGKKEPSQKLAS